MKALRSGHTEISYRVAYSEKIKDHGKTVITYIKTSYQFFTYVYGDRVAMVWVDKDQIISKGFSSLPEWKIHGIVRRNARKKGGELTAGHNILSLKLRLDGRN